MHELAPAAALNLAEFFRAATSGGSAVRVSVQPTTAKNLIR
jgi:hypothetical protein